LINKALLNALRLIDKLILVLLKLIKHY